MGRASPKCYTDSCWNIRNSVARILAHRVYRSFSRSQLCAAHDLLRYSGMPLNVNVSWCGRHHQQTRPSWLKKGFLQIFFQARHFVANFRILDFLRLVSQPPPSAAVCPFYIIICWLANSFVCRILVRVFCLRL